MAKDDNIEDVNDELEQTNNDSPTETTPEEGNADEIVFDDVDRENQQESNEMAFDDLDPEKKKELDEMVFDDIDHDKQKGVDDVVFDDIDQTSQSDEMVFDDVERDDTQNAQGSQESILVDPAELDTFTNLGIEGGKGIKLDLLMNLTLDVSIELGRTEMTIKDIALPVNNKTGWHTNDLILPDGNIPILV